MASRMADLGAAVTLLDLNEDSLALAVEQIRDAGGLTRGYRCDVSNREKLLV